MFTFFLQKSSHLLLQKSFLMLRGFLRFSPLEIVFCVFRAENNLASHNRSLEKICRRLDFVKGLTPLKGVLKGVRFIRARQSKNAKIAFVVCFLGACFINNGLFLKDGRAQGVLTIESGPEVIESKTEVIVGEAEVIVGEAELILPEDEDEMAGMLGAVTEETEAFGIYRDRKLLKKTLKDLDAYRVMLKNIGAHNDEYSRFLLIEEAGRYIDKYVDPHLNNQMTHIPEIFNLIASVRFFKASIFYESGEDNKYKEVIKGMEREYGDRHLRVAIAASNEEFHTIGEAIQLLQLRARKKK